MRLTRPPMLRPTRDGSGRSGLRGVIAAVVTPLSERGPDATRLVTLAQHLLNSGCDGLNVLGTTGEATSLSVDERMAVMSALAAADLPMNRLLVGTGAAALADAVNLSRHAAALGFAGILVLPPFYYKNVTTAGVLAYIRSIADATRETSVPIYLYNFPALSGVAYSLPLIGLLLKELGGRIAGLRDSSGDAEYVKDAASLWRSFDVFPSNEAYLLEAHSGVFAGCISATANLNFRHCAKAYRDGDSAALMRATAIRQIFEGLPLVSGVKHLMSEIYGDPSLARVLPPLSPLTQAEGEKVSSRFSEYLTIHGQL
jgi:4-hydroxy-tetrahydrodipicolinate synthase